MDNPTALVNLLSLSPWNVDVGREVVDAIAAQGRRAVPALTRMLRAVTAGALPRATAARLLGRIGGEDAAFALCGATSDRDPDVVAAVRRALRDVGPSPCPQQQAA